MTRPSLVQPLSRARQRLLLVALAAGLLWGTVAAAAALACGVWLDLVWELPPLARIAALVLAVVAAAGALALVVGRSWRQARVDRVARRLDQAGATGGVIVSGWELSGGNPSRGTSRGAMVVHSATAALPSVTSQLAELAVAHAARLASQISLATAIPLAPLRRAAAAACFVGLAVVIVALLFPSLARTQWQRFANPLGDVPPYSHIEFRVQPGDTQVVYGQGLDIHVEAIGRVVDRLELVVVEPASQDEAALPMFEQSEGQWRAALVRITEPSQYFVRAGRARSRRFAIGVVTVPRLESVQFRITPPAYTREAPYEGPLPKEGLAGLAGTRVEITARSNRPLASGRVSVTSGPAAETAEIQLLPAGEGADEVRGTLTIRASGRFELRVVDVAGQPSQDALAGAVTLLEDQRPLVRLLSPKPMSLATPSAVLPVAVAAEDDYGVSHAQLFRSLNNSRPLALGLPVAADQPRRLHCQEHLPLADYGLSPGDEIKLFARAEDNDPAGAKGAESQVVTVHIVSQQEFERLIRAREGLEVLVSKYQQAERRMEALAAELDKLQERLSQLPPDSPLADETRQEIERLAAEMQRQADAIDEAQQHLLPYDLDRHLTDQLAQVAKDLREASQATAQAGQSAASNAAAAAELKRQSARLGARRRQFQEEATEPLEHLAKIFPLIQDQSRFVLLAQSQRDLADRLATLKGKDQVDDPALKARMRDLEDEQRRLRAELDALLEDIENHVAQLPGDERLDKLRQTAEDFVAAVSGSGASQAMLDAESALADFRGTRGHAQAARAAEILESFLSQCEGMGGQCRGCLAFNPSLSKGLGNSIEQLLAEMGLGMGAGPGSGAGFGSGGGFSARRGGMNVGLYGGLPSQAGGQGGDGFGPSQAEAAGAGVYGGGSVGDPAVFDSASAGGTVGSTQGLVPPQYRKRVGAYFKRIAEEASP